MSDKLSRVIDMIGCGSHSCVVNPPTGGQGSNSGCMCRPDILRWMVGVLKSDLTSVKSNEARLVGRVRELEKEHDAVFASKLAIYEEAGKLQTRVRELEAELINFKLTASTEVINRDKKIKELEAMVEGMKCCGNCKRERVCKENGEHVFCATWTGRTGLLSTWQMKEGV